MCLNSSPKLQNVHVFKFKVSHTTNGATSLFLISSAKLDKIAILAMPGLKRYDDQQVKGHSTTAKTSSFNLKDDMYHNNNYALCVS